MRDVFTLIKNCIAVINSSLFEGWGNSLDYVVRIKLHLYPTSCAQREAIKTRYI